VTGSAETLERSAGHGSENGSANGLAVRLPKGPPLPIATAAESGLSRVTRGAIRLSFLSTRSIASGMPWPRIAALPSTARVDVPGLGSVSLCHGTPRSDEEIVTLVTPDERLGRILAGVEADVVVAGHTHSQVDRRVAGVRWVNGGSVGMPYEDEPGARWALLSADGVELRRTAYDREAAAERIRRSGMPGADAFAAEYVLAQHPPGETAPYFESLAAR